MVRIIFNWEKHRGATIRISVFTCTHKWRYLEVHESGTVHTDTINLIQTFHGVKGAMVNDCVQLFVGQWFAQKNGEISRHRLQILHAQSNLYNWIIWIRERSQQCCIISQNNGIIEYHCLKIIAWALVGLHLFILEKNRNSTAALIPE